MPAQSPHTPAERFGGILYWLTQAVAARTGWSLTLPLIGHIVGRLNRIKQCFADLAARIAAGKYSPRRRVAPPRGRPGHRPPQNKLPQKFGWLLALVPETVVYRSHLESLLLDPEMAALLAAAPTAMRRPLRSLCRMLRLPPPPILALPPRPKPPRAPRAKPEKPPPLARSRLGFHKGLPPLFPFTPGSPPDSAASRRQKNRPEHRLHLHDHFVTI
jgi:hypothetical protein